MKRPSRGRKQNRWADHYTRKAQKDKYPARSVYKLMEIQEKFRVLKKGQRVLDLGCAPGSWLLYAAEVCGPGGRVTGIDLQRVAIPLPKNAETRRMDIFSMGEDDSGSGLQVVLSDMAPATTGSRDADAVRSLELCEAALSVADARLEKGGALVMKIFQGEDVKAFTDKVRKKFSRVKSFKPRSCRKASREIYIIAQGKR